MSLILRQSTSKVVSFGPFLDKTDGVTEETGLVSALDHASTGIKLSKNGGALTIRHASVTATTYDAYGAYRVTLDTTDTDTVGTLRMAFNEAATCLPVWQDFQVVEEAVFDALFAASAPGYLQPTTAGRTLDVTAGGAAGIDWGNVENQATTVNFAHTTIDTVTVVANVNSTDSIATGGISNASFAADVGSTAYATNIIALAADKAIVNYGALKPTTAGRTLDVTTTGEAGIDWANIGGATSTVDLTGTSIKTVTTNVGVGTFANGAITSAAFATGAITAGAIAADAIGASELAADAVTEIQSGLATAAALTAVKAVTDKLDTAVELDGAVYRYTTNALEQAPTGGSAPTVAQIADGVWDEVLSGHLTAGTTGNALNAAGSAGDPWSTALPGAYGAGTAGKLIGDNINATVGSRATQTSVDAIKAKTDYLPSATAGNAGGVFIAGANAATSVATALTANIVGNVTGNISGSVGSVTGNVGGTVTGMVVDIALIDANVDAVLADTTTIIANMGVGGNGFTQIPWNAAWDAEVQSEVQDAIEANHLDHLLAADYDPASKPGVATALLNELIESDAGVSRFTANALEQAPTGGSAPTAAAVADAVWDEVLSGHLTAGTTGNALNAAGSAGDPWSTALPGAYGAGTAGKIIGDNLNAPIGTVDTVVDAIKAKTDNLPSDPADASDIAASFSTVNGTLATIAAYIDTEVAAIKAKTDNLPSSPAAVGSAMTLATDAISAAALSAAAVDEILDEVIEDTVTLRQALRNLLALTNKSSRSGSTIYFRDVADLKTRLAITFDSNADRTAVSRDLT